MDTNHSPTEKRNQLHSSSAALRWILSTVVACSVACVNSKSAVADAPSTDTKLQGKSQKPPKFINPFPDREKSEEILALEVVFDQQLQTPIYYSGDTSLEQVLIEQSHSGKSYTYYNLQIRLDGIISMYEASGREDHFLLALELCENMVAAANEDRDGDGHPEWDATLNGSPPPDGRPDRLLPDLQGSVAIARMARLIKSDPVLEAAYGDRA